jgi:hypothetical protein
MKPARNLDENRDEIDASKHACWRTVFDKYGDFTAFINLLAVAGDRTGKVFRHLTLLPTSFFPPPVPFS